MAHAPDLFIEGERIPKVKAVTYEVYTSKDVRGKPSDQARLAKIKVVREADGTNTLFRWACKSTTDNFKGGEIVFKNPQDGQEMKRLIWTDGFLTSYKEIYPDFDQSKSNQIFEEFEISAQKVEVGDGMLDGNWEDIM
ncbi:MAG: hypothetical protein J7K40_07710 [candidate division Zixibacteria bacterium]|nr:hypothetical protein [candidate division Zixibacteria bacterium]